MSIKDKGSQWNMDEAGQRLGLTSPTKLVLNTQELAMVLQSHDLDLSGLHHTTEGATHVFEFVTPGRPPQFSQAEQLLVTEHALTPSPLTAHGGNDGSVLPSTEGSAVQPHEHPSKYHPEQPAGHQHDKHAGKQPVPPADHQNDQQSGHQTGQQSGHQGGHPHEHPSKYHPEQPAK